jgi:hypothetical protein
VTPSACPAALNTPVTYHAHLQLGFPQGGDEPNIGLTDQIEQGTIIG